MTGPINNPSYDAVMNAPFRLRAQASHPGSRDARSTATPPGPTSSRPRQHPPRRRVAPITPWAVAASLVAAATVSPGCQRPTANATAAAGPGAGTAPSPAPSGAAGRRADAGGGREEPAAETDLRDKLAALRETRAADDPVLAGAIGDLAEVLGSRQAWDEAVPLAREALDISRNALGNEHPETLAAKERLAAQLSDCVWSSGASQATARAQAGEAVALLREVVIARSRDGGPEWAQVRSRARLGAALVVSAFAGHAGDERDPEAEAASLREAEALLAAGREALGAQRGVLEAERTELEQFVARWEAHADWVRVQHAPRQRP